MIPDAAAGQYQVTATGYNNGSVAIRVDHVDTTRAVLTNVFAGATTTGQVDRFTIAYDPNNPTAAPQPVVLRDPVNYTANGWSVITEDLNNDNKTDLVVSKGVGVGVLLGNGNGSFQSVVDYASGTSDTSPEVRVGDFGGDGALDLVTVYRNGDSIRMWRGNGNGTFQTAVRYGTTTYPIALDTGDFNGDGRDDVAVGGTSSIDIHLGQSDGSLRFQTEINPLYSPHSVVARDVNKDGNVDLVAAMRASDTVSVFLGNGNATFQPAVDYPVGDDPHWVAVGDFDRDGTLDLVAASLTGKDVRVLMGNGDGTFRVGSTYTFGTYPRDVTVGDLNGDNYPELVVTINSSANIHILIGNGDGTFRRDAAYTLSANASTTAIKDFDGNKSNDLAVANGSNISVLLNRRSGSGFPTTVVLDTFNRAAGAPGSAWIGQTNAFQVNNNTLEVTQDGAMYWNNSFGADQEAYVTFRAVDTNADEINLLLKGQGTGQCDLLEVSYLPRSRKAQVVTCHNNGTWIQHGADMPVTFAAGDQLGARVRADGAVDVYKNGALIGTTTVSSAWPYRANSGRIGLWTINANATIFDTIGGGARE
jgi:hypothetical protein